MIRGAPTTAVTRAGNRPGPMAPMPPPHRTRAAAGGAHPLPPRPFASGLDYSFTGEPPLPPLNPFNNHMDPEVAAATRAPREEARQQAQQKKRAPGEQRPAAHNGKKATQAPSTPASTRPLLQGPAPARAAPPPTPPRPPTNHSAQPTHLHLRNPFVAVGGGLGSTSISTPAAAAAAAAILKDTTKSLKTKRAPNEALSHPDQPPAKKKPPPTAQDIQKIWGVLIQHGARMGEFEDRVEGVEDRVEVVEVAVEATQREMEELRKEVDARICTLEGEVRVRVANLAKGLADVKGELQVLQGRGMSIEVHQKGQPIGTLIPLEKVADKIPEVKSSYSLSLLTDGNVHLPTLTGLCRAIMPPHTHKASEYGVLIVASGQEVPRVEVRGVEVSQFRSDLVRCRDDPRCKSSLPHTVGRMVKVGQDLTSPTLIYLLPISIPTATDPIKGVRNTKSRLDPQLFFKLAVTLDPGQRITTFIGQRDGGLSGAHTEQGNKKATRPPSAFTSTASSSEGIRHWVYPGEYPQPLPSPASPGESGEIAKIAQGLEKLRLGAGVPTLSA